MNVIQDEWVVTRVDLGGSEVIYRGPDQAQAWSTWATAKADNQAELGVIIQHTFLAS